MYAEGADVSKEVVAVVECWGVELLVWGWGWWVGRDEGEGGRGQECKGNSPTAPFVNAMYSGRDMLLGQIFLLITFGFLNDQ